MSLEKCPTSLKIVVGNRPEFVEVIPITFIGIEIYDRITSLIILNKPTAAVRAVLHTTHASSFRSITK